ncbi:hypothetical protein GQ53DRAFT_657685 [Thozetella sp. PMI_491]|nr:hypothetical protein GQ53DRAFT_657685 [Thozetella sp. PMI_491]
MAITLLRAWLAILILIISSTAASPRPAIPRSNSLLYSNSSVALGDVSTLAAKPFYLRVAPLGASIVNGYLSSDGNGFRKPLRDQLRQEGWPVNMVGGIKTGTMADNDNEGHIGYLIQYMIGFALPNLIPLQPNLVLINVGTNNAIQDNDVAIASDHYIELLDKLWEQIPGATVIISTLIPNKVDAANTRAEAINVQLRTTVMSHYTALGKKLFLADMNDGFITKADLNDDTHPTDYGYKKMASVWWSAFQSVESKGWLTAPPDVGIPDTPTSYTCPKVYGQEDGNYQIQLGSGTDDGNYVHKSQDQGVVWRLPFLSPAVDSTLDGFFFAQLVNAGGNPNRGGEVDEIIWAQASGSSWSWMFWTNNNNNNFGTQVNFDPGINCAPRSARFADLNNDGLDDFICIDHGALRASINRGGNPPRFENIGVIAATPAFWTDDFYTADLVHLADIDGDGRADWCLFVFPGVITCQRNGGQGDMPSWVDFSTGSPGWTLVFPVKENRGNPLGVNLVDINGDFKSDWLYMDNTGKIDTSINQRGTGTGMVPDWNYAGFTHDGISGVTNGNSAFKFGRMYGSGRRDYIYLRHANVGSDNRGTVELRIWKNLGSGGTYLKGDGTHYCDMNGDGTDDYIWVGPNGEIDIYLNIGLRPYWENHQGVTTLGVPRKTIHLADLDGDGRCDFLSVDKVTGAVRMWLNNWDGSSRTWKFVDQGIVSGSAGCSQGYGVIENDLGVRFADLTGDKKADYLCIEKNGHVTGYLNRGMSSGKVNFEDIGQIKIATNYDRQNVRWNDVNGDGRADLLYIDNYSGDTTVWLNAGEIPTGGSHFKWDIQGPLYKGWDRGSNMNFGALGGQGRADIIQVVPRSNTAWVAYNKCPVTGTGGDDPGMGDPGLPAYTPKR